MNKKNIYPLLLVIIALSLPSVGQAALHYNKVWLDLDVTGPFFETKKIRYQMHPQLRFTDDAYKFQHAILNLALGYPATKNVTGWMGNTWRNSRRRDGAWTNEYRIWQQMSANFTLSGINIASRTRLEERKRIENKDIALRLRERLTFTIPLPVKKYSIILYDELFFHLNHPDWVSNRFLSQNRAFIGIGIELSKVLMLEMGYLNQFEQHNQLNNVFNFVLRARN